MIELRTSLQNRHMWPMLEDIARQIPWEVNGTRVHISKEDFKAILSAAYCKEVRLARSVDGSGFVMLGARTSQFAKTGDVSMAGFLDFLYAFGAERGVRWSDPKLGDYERWAA